MRRAAWLWLMALGVAASAMAGCGPEAIADKGNLNFDVLIAYAGTDQYVEQGSEVTLKAKNLAADAAVRWELLEKPAASAVALQDDTLSEFVFTADAFGTWEFKLTAMRGSEETSDTVRVSTIFHAPPFDTGAMTFYYDPRIPSAQQTAWTPDDGGGLMPPDVAEQSPVVISEQRAMDTGRFFSTRCEFAGYRFAPARLAWTGVPGSADGMGLTFAAKTEESWTEAFVCLNEEACGGRWFRLATIQGSTPGFKAGKALPENRQIGDVITIVVRWDDEAQATVATLADDDGVIVELSVDDSLFGWGGVGSIVYRPRADSVFTALDIEAHIKAVE